MYEDLQVRKTFPDLELPDHTGATRRLSELTEEHPTVVNFYRGWWCRSSGSSGTWWNCRRRWTSRTPASCPPPSTRRRSPRPCAPGSAHGGRSCPTLPGRVQRDLDLEETSDRVHRPFLPYTFVLDTDLTIGALFNGYWYWGRPTNEELRLSLREILRASRSDWDAQAS